MGSDRFGCDMSHRATEREITVPPLGTIRIRYDIHENPKGNCYVAVGDKVVCELPISKATWDLEAGELGVVTIQLLAERTNVDAIEP